MGHAGAGGVGADVGQRVDAQREDLAVGIERELSMRGHIAPVRGRQEFLAAVGHPFHRALQHMRAVRDGDVFRVGAGLHAEAAADIADHHAHLLLRQADGVAHRAAHARRHLGAHADAEAARAFLDVGQHHARLDRERHHTLVDDVERHHVHRLREGGGRGVYAAVARLRGDVAGRLVEDLGRARCRRGREVDHHRQFLVVHEHGLGCVARLLDRVGHHRHHRLTHEAHAFVRQHAPRRRHARPAVRALEAGGAGHRLDACCRQIGTAHDADDAGHLERGRCVDRDDARMRVRRAHEDQVREPGGLHVVRVAAGAGQEGLVFQPADGLAAAKAEGIGGCCVVVHA